MYLQKLILLKEINESIHMDKKSICLQSVFILLLSIVLPIITTHSLLGEIAVYLLFFRVSMYSVLLIVFSFSIKIFFIERVQGTLIPLLSTPMKITDIILGKSLFLVIIAVVLSILAQVLVFIYFTANNSFLIDSGRLLLQTIIQTLFVVPFFAAALSNGIGLLTIKAMNNRTASLSALLPAAIVFILINYLTNKFEILTVQILLVILCIICNLVIYFFLKYGFSSESILYERYETSQKSKRYRG